MKTSGSLPLLLSLLITLTIGLLNCKKETDPVKPGGTTGPGSNTSTTATTPVVSTVAPVASGIASTSGAVSATLTGNGGAAIIQYGFVYSKTNQTPALSDSKTEQGATSGPFPLTVTSKLTGLEASTTYYVRAYATNDKGTGYGTVGQLMTRAADVTVRSYTASTATFIVTATSVNVDGGVDFPEGATLGDIGFCYADDKPEPTIADTKALDSKPFLGTDKRTASFKGFLPDLKPATTYQIRPFATIDNVVHYGAVLTVTIKALLSTATLTRKADFPGKTVSGRPVSFVIGDKFYLNARKGTGDDSQFFMYDPTADTWTQKADLPMTGTNYKGGANGISFTHNGKGYFGLSSGFSAKKELWEYEASTDTWKDITTLKANPFGSWSLETENVYLNGKVYGITYEKKLIEFDVESQQASEKALPTGLEATANHLIVANKTLYFYNSFKQTFAAYNGQTNMWTSKNKPPYISQMVSVGNQLYLFGSGLISLYDPSSDTWKSVLDLGTSTTVSQTYGRAFSPQSVFSRPANAYMGMTGSGVNGWWFEFNP